MAEKEKIVSREELLGLVQLVIMFTAILAGREIGNLYSSYGELTHMSVNLNFSEEEMAGYLRDAMQGKNSTLNVGMAVTIPGFTNTEGQVTETPDYVRKWLISVTLSPIVVTQPEVSDVELTFKVEGQSVMTRSYTFPREKVGYISFLKRSLPLSVDDEETFTRIVREAAAEHAGEVEVTVTGRVKANVFFFESMLPFETTKYPMVSAPSLILDGSHWGTLDGSGRTARVGELSYVEMVLSNPTRVHSLTQNVTCRFYREGENEPVATVTKKTTAAAGTVSTYFFSFTPTDEGTYYYIIESSGFTQTDTPRLTVSP